MKVKLEHAVIGEQKIMLNKRLAVTACFSYLKAGVSLTSFQGSAITPMLQCAALCTFGDLKPMCLAVL